MFPCRQFFHNLNSMCFPSGSSSINLKGQLNLYSLMYFTPHTIQYIISHHFPAFCCPILMFSSGCVICKTFRGSFRKSWNFTPELPLSLSCSCHLIWYSLSCTPLSVGYCSTTMVPPKRWNAETSRMCFVPAPFELSIRTPLASWGLQQFKVCYILIPSQTTL